MCDIGKPLEVIDVEPLDLPPPLPRAKSEAEQEAAVFPAVPATETTLAENV